MITAYATILNEVSHDLVIAGESFSRRSRIRELIDQMSSEQKTRIRITGFISREDLLGLYQMADALVFPSLFEGFGIPALEAMDSGCPVIASRATSLPEIIGSAGEFFDPLDCNDIADALERVCLNEDLRSDLKRPGHERAREFSWRKMAEETLALYELAASQGSPRTIASYATSH